MSSAASSNFAVKGTQVLDQHGADVIISVGWTLAGRKGRAGRGGRGASRNEEGSASWARVDRGVGWEDWAGFGWEGLGKAG